MGALKLLVFVTSAVFLLEIGLQHVAAAPSGTYSITTLHRSSSSANSITPTASKAPTAASPAGSYGRGDLDIHDYRRYLPVEDTPEVKKAREQFFRLYEKQARLAAETPDNDLDGVATKTYVMTKVGGEDRDHETDYYYYDYEGDNEGKEEGDGSEEEGEEGSDDNEEEDEEEEGEDSSEGDEGEGDSSEDEEEEDSEEGDSSSAEDDGDGDDSSEEGEDSSSSEEGDDDSASSSSEEDDDDGQHSLHVPSPNINSLSAPRPVTDTPEVKQAKRNFFDLYKTQAELSFSAPDDH